MSQRAMISVAGFRGIVGQSLTAEDFFRYALGFGTLVSRGVVVVGRDARPSGEMIRDVVCGALRSTGCEVIDLGVVPTPTVGLMVRELRARGGIAITASHNPIEWNALKFFRKDGTLQRSADHERLLAVCESGKFRRAQIRRPVQVVHNTAGPETHIKRVIRNIGARRIRKRRFCVAIDCCNGAGTSVLPELLSALGCRVTVLFGEQHGRFERTAEPLPENLEALAREVRRVGADVGFAVDPDADRLAIVDESGRPIGEERSVTLCANHVLARKRSPLVVNLSTTRATDDVARLHGVRLHRAPVGEAHVVGAMRRRHAGIGGEGNGGVIWPAVTSGRDAAAGIGLILDALTGSRGPVSALNSRVPDYVMLKKKLPLGRKGLRGAFSRLEEKYSREGRVCRDDGLRIDLPDEWFHLRPSGTEPIVRLIVESTTNGRAEQLAAEVAGMI